MDSDEWDDDIADEDLITALTQASQTRPETFTRATPASITTSDLSQYDTIALHRAVPQTSGPDHSSNRLAQPSSAAARTQGGNTFSNFRQTTLWGGPAPEQSDVPQSQVQSKRVYRADMPAEAPTHHKLDRQALKTWVYPTNLGPVRDYQYSIVKNGIFNNTLVALPTGLGKTFIAATVMLNFFRWTKDAKLIFVAPTKPLASQQVEACLNVAGIPRSQATLLTGETSPALREGEWEKRRLFFMTPQTLQNDLSKGYANPKAIALLVIDEAHRATGDYAYVKVVEFLRRFNPSFRVLALTATPGSTVEGVQAVIDSLGISTIEIRTEESIDIRRYVHSREVDQVILEPSDEMLHVQDLFSQTLRPLCNKLAQVNKWLARDPMTLTVMGLREAQRQWFLGAGRHANPGTKGMITIIFAILQSLAHAIKLLNYHGIAPFYHKMVDFRSEVEQQGSKGSKYRRQILQDEHFQEMMDTIDKWQRLDGFVGHPKLSYLCENLLNHFMDAGEGSSTRAIVFSEYRDSAEEIVRTLNKHKPMIKATIFVGQADSKRSEGMKQKQQIETIEKFRSGEFNVLVATSIGEEGLDIGQVDLIVCYDASASPIRMLQRMGRTGRKRAGNITLLLMKGREEEQYKKAKDNYEKMQRFICEGTRFNFRNDLSSRIIPRDVKPEVEMRMVDIPIENTQNTSLPEPKKGTAARKKATQKKFHMPDGVVTGFLKASEFDHPEATASRKKPRTPHETDVLAELPSLNTVLLNCTQVTELDRAYRNLPALRASQEDVTGPDLGAQPKAQRKLGPVANVKHGAHTKRCVKLFKVLANTQSACGRHMQPYNKEHQSRYKQMPMPTFAEDTDLEAEGKSSAWLTAKSSKRQRPLLVDEDADDSPPKRRKAALKSRIGTGRHSHFRNPFIESDEEEDDDDVSIADDKEDGVTRALGKQFKPKAKAKSQSGAARSGRNDDTFEDYGDDCTRTSQLYESDGSDSGADLLGFIDDDPISSMQPSSPSCTSTLAATSAKKPPINKQQQEKKEPFYEFMSTITSSQDSDGDLVSLSQLGRPKPATTKPRLFKSDDEAENAVPKQAPALRRRKRQAVLDESDFDYE